MNPEISGIDLSNLATPQKQQSTQTSGVSISSQSLQDDVVKSEKGSVALFEFCHILQEPEYPNAATILNESVSEDIKKHQSKNTGNRYKFCKEIIEPYTPDFSGSSEDLLKEALESAKVDFSDFQSCLDVYTGQKAISDIKQPSTESNISKIDVTTSYSAMGDASDECVEQCKTEDNSEECAEQCEQEQSSSSPASPKVKYCGPVKPKPKCLEPPKKACKPKIKKVCPKESVAKCDNEPATVIVLGERPQFMESDPSKENSDESQNSFVGAHNKTVTTIKTAMDDFMDKVYKTSQEAISLVATESVKQLIKIKRSESENSDIEKVDNEHKGSVTNAITSFFRKTNDKQAAEKNESNAAEMIGSIITKVDSALIIVKNQVSKSIESFPKTHNFNDKSSPYDKPKPKPTDIAHTFTPGPVPASNSYFSAIKSKICSMFSDAEPKVEEEAMTLSGKSSTTSCPSLHDNDGDDEHQIEEMVD